MRFIYSVFLTALLFSPATLAQTYYSAAGFGGCTNSSQQGCCDELGGAGCATGDPNPPWQLSGNQCKAFRTVSPFDACGVASLSTHSCAGGTYYDNLTDTCTACDEGYEYNAQSGSCEPIPPDCPSGWEDAEIMTEGSSDYFRCIPSVEPDDCTVALGFVVNDPVCEPIYDECLGFGGSYAMFNGVEACLPPQDPPPPPEIPDCSGSTILTINQGSYSCTPIYDSPEQPLGIGNPGEGQGGGDQGEDSGNGTNSGPVARPDTDGDGTPNVEDPDIDGDGTPNSSDLDVDGDGTPNSMDSDIDGDGTPNDLDGDMDGDGINNSSDNDTDGDGITNDVDNDDDGDGVADGDDTTQTGAEGEDGTDTEDSVSGGGTCESQPTCTGKEPILCAILRQQWETRCALDGDFETNSEIDSLISENDPSGLYGDDIDLTPELNSVFNQTEQNASCPADRVMTLGTVGSISFSYQPMCDLADAIRPLVLLMFAFFGFRIVMRAF